MNKKQSAIVKNKEVAKAIERCLTVKGKVKLTGVGIFKVKKMKSRIGWSVGTRKAKKFKSYNKIHFSPTKKLRDKVQ